MDDPPPPKQKWTLTQADFDRLLAWLDPDPERAGQKYEKIRSTLIGRFRRLDCVEPEARANETIDRVAQTLPKVIAKYKGDPEPYFYAVAYYIYLEYIKVTQPEQLPETDLPERGTSSSTDDDEAQDEALDECLSLCLTRLDEPDRNLFVRYYNVSKEEKIRRRKQLADELGVAPEYLRVLVQRIKLRLKKCILGCLSERGE